MIDVWGELSQEIILRHESRCWSRFLNLRRRSFIVSNVQMEGGLFMDINLMIIRGGNVVGQTG